MPRTVWIGGGSGAGKSTVARALVARHGLHMLDTDASMTEHARRCPPERCPRLAEFLAMSPDQRWVERTPHQMMDFHWYAGEAFDLVLEDLAAVPPGTPVLVEGFRLLPRLVAPLLGGASRAVWLLPTPAFREAAFASRGTTAAIVGATSDPRRALANLLARDTLFTEVLRAETARLRLDVVEVDVGTGQDEVLERVEALLGP